ncbi:DUF2284 domain-containing protein [Intestinibacter sp.]
MIDYDLIKTRALEAGFSVVEELDCSTIQLMPEVRDMCASNKCHQYDKNWACPPGCGSLEECKENIKGYKKGIIVQTVGQLEDSMDFEGMMELEEKHKQAFLKFSDELKDKYDNVFSLGVGSCIKCKECTYPDNPCRFPDKMVSSMESYGMLVSQVCKDNNVKYYYGPNTLAYTGCFLIE